ncbi:MAG: hypothetical protein ACI8RD_004127 [Bacillariaceae sp.]|jgi:hypothetical protein
MVYCTILSFVFVLTAATAAAATAAAAVFTTTAAIPTYCSCYYCGGIPF